MPHLYNSDLVWCTHCGESRDAKYDKCPECHKMLRRKTRQRKYKDEVKRI